MRWVLYIGGGLIGLVMLVLLIGALLPKAHVATVRARFRAPADRVYAVIDDVARGADWRTGLKRVEILSQPGEPLKWREVADWGTLTFVREEARAPERIVSRIADVDQGFGGTWVYQISTTDGGTEVRVTENGEVYSPLFRFMSRFVFGHYRTLETYVADLARHLGETVATERVSGG